MSECWCLELKKHFKLKIMFLFNVSKHVDETFNCTKTEFVKSHF